VEGSCHLIISDGTIKASEGKSEKPDLVIKTPFDVWMDIQTGKEDGGQMFMKEKYKAEGDMELFLNMSKFFGKNH
jgi:putative sterol carrier protein